MGLYLKCEIGEHTFYVRKGVDNMDVVEKTIIFPNLRAEKARRGDTNESLGALLGISPPSVARRLSGQIAWSINEIELLCKHYDMPYEILFARE